MTRTDGPAWLARLDNELSSRRPRRPCDPFFQPSSTLRVPGLKSANRALVHSLISPPGQLCHCRSTIGEPRAACRRRRSVCRMLVWERSMQRVGVTHSLALWHFDGSTMQVRPRTAPASAVLLHSTYSIWQRTLQLQSHAFKSTEKRATGKATLIFNPAMNCGNMSQPPPFVWISNAGCGLLTSSPALAPSSTKMNPLLCLHARHHVRFWPPTSPSRTRWTHPLVSPCAHHICTINESHHRSRVSQRGGPTPSAILHAMVQRRISE